ncbi:Molybdenum cofactor sulfurase [Penicillium diatomitis]|uniref:Molybdenum cofactor sulfurase n=1 Tax=Penicillium diatomitis TaxID=2819901 RepID=A0A9X0BSE5_9EURO|nr:Molybdenum cofactor sulfurase [Penicillium diatomitis]KAJ5480682.1 Molybdenum cofactor sulfurase [Penicillium diatomitis]
MTSSNADQYPSGYSEGYSADVDIIREQEYPLLNDTTYLDHAGTTPYAKSTIEEFSRQLTSNLFGNPHSMSLSSQLSTQRTDDIRLRVLQFFNADPDEFDLVFVANATAAIKLVADGLRDSDHRGFWYGYHSDAHTSLVGVRELAEMGHRCFQDDADLDTWIKDLPNLPTKAPKLVAFPAQSNMNGRRLPLRWCKELRSAAQAMDGNVFTLLDAASFVSTGSLDISAVSPDFTALSFYKIFGFPDLGALIVRKKAARVFERRKYFGGGTVDMVIAAGAQWHAKKESSVHELLEDGTLPFHNIIALDAALDTHKRLYGSMTNVSRHTACLAKRVYDRLSVLSHWNQTNVCHMYQPGAHYGSSIAQGPIIAFNLQNSKGEYVPKTEIEKLANVQNIQLRTGSVCNPGGTANALGWTGLDLRRHYSTGLRCGDAHDIIGGRPTGVVRVSLGAMTNMKDVESLVNFIEEFYVEKIPPIMALKSPMDNSDIVERHFYVESLSVFPIKSCAAFKIPEGKRWEIKQEGLAWDREWCLIHQGTGTALNQKRYPRMALIRPSVDLERSILRITCGVMSEQVSLEISLSWEDTSLISTSSCPNTKRSSTVCGDRISLHAYSSPVVSAFFSDFLGVPCTLARFPSHTTHRYARPRRSSGVWRSRFRKLIMPGAFPLDLPPPVHDARQIPLSLSNESPLLIVSRSSVNRLNETIKAGTKSVNSGHKAVAADVFRGNIVVAERLASPGDTEQPYAEDHWSSVRIGPDQLRINVLDACQRCQMVCIDQFTGLRSAEPFSTLAKTRNINGKVCFGKYAALAPEETEVHHPQSDRKTVMVGDVIMPSYDDEEHP